MSFQKVGNGLPAPVDTRHAGHDVLGCTETTLERGRRQMPLSEPDMLHKGEELAKAPAK
jgi:hypothetical protein